MKNRSKKIMTLVAVGLSTLFLLTGCSIQSFNSSVNALKGSITGNTYTCEFFSNHGEKFLTAEGTNIDLSSNVVKEKTYNSDGGWGFTKSLSSVITITIDGKQIETCGSTVIFAERGLKPDVDFTLEDIDSEAAGIGDMTSVAGIVNQYKNSFGKPVVVVIQSQMGDPITAYSGNDVYWQVCEDLPKTTKLMVDGKALYIHRANFLIVDQALLN